uniref:protein-ribulosamine 3-kinase n=1 Tax=Oryzias latipes TaxID=8090 RepID=A0A3B3H9V9_ORYLA
MEAKLKKELGTSKLKATGHSGGGCISEGQSYDTDSGKVFVKINHKSEAKLMFDGEMASLEAIFRTETVKVPKPIKVIELDRGGCVFVMEHLDMKGLNNRYSKQLGEQLADLHLHNKTLQEKLQKEQQTVGKGPAQSEVAVVEKFGFDVATCCGYLPQSSLTRQLSMGIPSMSLGSLECLVVSTSRFTLLTIKRFLKIPDLKRETSFTNFSTI